MQLSSHSLVFSLFLAPALACASACASQSPDPPTPVSASTTSSLSAPGASPASSKGIDQMKRGGDYMFALDESDPASQFRAQCTKNSGGDTAKADACYAQVREEGSHEGMRFSIDGQQRLVWTSFGRDGGKEEIYLEGPLSVTTDGEHGVVATFAAPPHGLQMEGKPAWPKKPLRFEFVDAKTLVMTDEIKGRLVFHPTSP